ncbi:MAG: hypothetical protein MR398_05525 [Oscillospiraceae bacterium]|nr:hypothetical protein [Oscillospiraceae bacterium]
MTFPQLYFLSFLMFIIGFGTKYFLMREDIKEISDELTFYKQKYEQLKLDQIQELLDDRDFGNND